MTKLPTSPEALRRLADAMEKQREFICYTQQVRSMPLALRWEATSLRAEQQLSTALAKQVQGHWDLLVTAALADFDKEVLLAHAAVQDSLEDK